MSPFPALCEGHFLEDMPLEPSCFQVHRLWNAVVRPAAQCRKYPLLSGREVDLHGPRLRSRIRERTSIAHRILGCHRKHVVSADRLDIGHLSWASTVASSLTAPPIFMRLTISG